MIPVLFKPTETDKRKLMKGQGLGALAEVISCKVAHTENKGYICEVEYPIYGRRAKDIVQEGIIRAKANDIDAPQLFRIKEIDTQTKPKTMILYCEHLFYDLKDNFIEHVFAEKVDVMGAGRAILGSTTRSHLFEMGDTNLTADPLVRDFTLDRCNPCDAFRGIEGSLIDTYNNGKGITIYPDNFKINVYSQIGGGGTITYKKNLVGIERKDSVLDVVTVIYPYAKVNDENNNETTITLDEKFLYAADEDLNAYVHYKIVPIDFSGESVIDQDSLRSAAQTYLKDMQTKPKVTYIINLAPIRKTTEYEDLKFIEGYRVGYMVNVNDKRFKLNNVPVKVNKLVYNSLTEEVEQVVLGNNITSLGGVIDNKITDTNKTIEVIKTQFEQQFEQAVNELTDKINSGINGHTIKTENEYFVIDTLDPNTAQHVSRFNINGIAFSSNGINGPYIGLTSDGQLVINETTCKKFTAQMINAGKIQSLDKSCWFDLDTATLDFGGYIQLSNNADGTKKFKITLSDGTDVEKKLSTVATKSEITSTANEIKMSVGETGAYNMIKNSRAEQNTNFWHGSVLRFGNSSSASLTNGTYFRVDNNTTSEKFMYSDVFAVKPNTTYTLVLTLMRSAYCTGIDLHFLGLKDKSKVDTNTTSYDYVHTVVANKVYTEGAWVKEVVTFTTKSDELCGYLRFDNNGSSTAGTLCKAYFTDILMYEGTIKNDKGDIIAKPWSPYPAELYGSSVIVDKKGLEVKNKNGDRTFRADTEDGVSLTGTLLQYDLSTGNYSLEIADNMVNFFDRWDTLGDHKNVIGNMGSIQVKGSYFGYNIGNTQDTRVGVGIIADVGDFVALCSRDANGNSNPMFIMENSNGLNINQGNRFGFMQDVAFLNGAYPKWYGTLHNFIGDIHFDSNSKMNIWGTGGHIFTAGTKNIMATSETGVTVYGVFTDSSDLAFKTNVQPLEKDTLQIVKDIDIYEYEENGTAEIGLLAQQAVEVIPDIIKGTPTDTTIEEANTMTEEERSEKLKNGGASVDVYSMISILWDANKKLIDKVERLENKVEELENKIK